MLNYIPDAPLSEINWYKIGGKAKYLFYPKNELELIKCLSIIEAQSLPFFIIGGGSNVLIGDYDFNGAVICLKEINKIELIDDFTIRVGAGVSSTDVAEFAYKNALEGAEFLYKLPGTVGGALVMNAKAYGCEMSQIVYKARVIDFEGNKIVFENKDMEYEYKSSIFQNHEFIVYEIELFLEKGHKDVIRAKMDYNSDNREIKKQFEFPSAGCVFKNHYETNTPAGKLIDELGLKGFTIGGATVFPDHANFIVNKKDAKAKDVLEIIKIIKNKAKEQRDIDLDLELKMYGNFGNEDDYTFNLKLKKKK